LSDYISNNNIAVKGDLTRLGSKPCLDCNSLKLFNDGAVRFHVTGWSSYDLGENRHIDLVKGWNLISPYSYFKSRDSINKTILLNKGWNLFGYSSNESFNWSDALVSNGTTTKPITEASDWLQTIIYYFDPVLNIYKIVPMDDDYLRKSKGYWLYALMDNLTLILSSISGSAVDDRFEWGVAKVYDGSDFLSIANARRAELLQSTIYYYDNGYKFIPGNDDYTYPWKGYWLYSNENLTLIIE